MAGFQVTELIDRPPKEVFDYVSDLQNIPHWLPGVVEVEIATKGPVGAGTRYIEVRRFKKGQGKVEMEIEGYDPPQRISTQFDRGGYKTTYFYTFEAEGAGTRAKLDCVISTGGLKKLKLPLVVWAIKLQDKYQLRSLKAAIEGKS